MWRTAMEAQHFAVADVSARRLVRQWREDMELAFVYAQADALPAAKGAFARVAGQANFPVGRMVRRARAAAGERVELLHAACFS